MPAKTTDQKIEKLARTVEKGFEGTHGEIKGLREELKLEIKSVKKELSETEERLLFAIENTEVKKRDFEALTEDVREIEKRVGVLEKSR